MPTSVRVPELVNVAPATTVLVPLRVQFAFASIVAWAKLMNWVPRPLSVPALAPDASSSVLIDTAPMVLPPSTVPAKAAPWIDCQKIREAGGKF